MPFKVAEVLTLCGKEHYELELEHWKYKRRIVHHGERILDSDNNLLLFEETAALIAHNIAIWYACLETHTATCSDAVQVFLQSELDEKDLFYHGTVAERVAWEVRSDEIMCPPQAITIRPHYGQMVAIAS